jgi:1,2-diacylglycerol 3-beta-glucosyltransferase
VSVTSTAAKHARGLVWRVISRRPLPRLGDPGESWWAMARRRWRGRPPIVIDLIVGGAAFLILGAGRFLSVANLIVNAIFICYFFRHAAFAVAAARWTRTDLDLEAIDLGYAPPLSVLVACHNEETVVSPLIKALSKLNYDRRTLQMIVIDDGSGDDTGKLLDEGVVGHDDIEVLHRPAGLGGGKSGALNYALDQLTGEVVVVFDADHKPRADCLQRLARHFRDPQTAAVMGRCWIGNASETWLAGAVYVDYLSGYLVNQYGRQALFELPAYGGANCAVRASVLEALGGWNEGTVTEDTDLTLRCLLKGYRVRFDPTATDAEEGTTNVRRFIKQRYRWARGHQGVFRDYWKQLLRCRYLTPAEKVESIMFLLVYHVPVAIAASAVLAVVRLCGVGASFTVIDVLPLAGLLFVGPMSELAVGLMVDRAPRRWVFSMLLVYPLFILFTVVCTRSWLDGALGRRYTWVKTVRSGFQAPEDADAPADGAS